MKAFTTSFSTDINFRRNFYTFNAQPTIPNQPLDTPTDSGIRQLIQYSIFIG